MTIASILSDLWRVGFLMPPPSPQAQELQKSPGGIGLTRSFWRSWSQGDAGGEGSANC